MLALEGFTEYTIIVIMHCVILCLVCLFSPYTVCIVLYSMYQLHIFSSSTPKGKPSLSLDLAGGNVTEYETKKHMYCVQIVSSKKTVFLSFDSRYDQSVWLKRAAKVSV